MLTWFNDTQLKEKWHLSQSSSSWLLCLSKALFSEIVAKSTLLLDSPNKDSLSRQSQRKKNERKIYDSTIDRKVE